MNAIHTDLSRLSHEEARKTFETRKESEGEDFLDHCREFLQLRHPDFRCGDISNADARLINRVFNRPSKSSLSIAILLNNLDVMEYLITRLGVSITDRESTVIIEATARDQRDTVQLLLEHGADPTVHKNTAIIKASAFGHCEIVQLLLEHGADPTDQENGAIIEASESGQRDAVQLLLEHGADPTAQENEAIVRASESGQRDVVQLLLEHGADPRSRAIIEASACGHLEIVKIYLEGAPKRQIFRSYLAACEKNQSEVVEYTSEKLFE